MSELAVIEQAPALDVVYWGGVLTFAAQVADAVSDTEFVPGALRGRREAVAATILYGAEVGLTPMQSLAGIHIVDGRPAPSAELMRAMILRAGHTLMVTEMTGTRARVWGQRRGRPDSERVVVDWSLDMARAAGLLGRGAWQRYPRAMLVARATGDLARLLFPDVVKGLGYVAEDEPEALEAWAPADGAAVPEAPARKPLQRRKRSPASTPVREVAAPVLEAHTPDTPVAPIPDEPEVGAYQRPDELADAQAAHDENRDAGRWLTDEEALADQNRIAEEARAVIESELADDELAKPSDVPPPFPKGHAPGDVPLPDELRPVGTGQPLPRAAPVPTSSPNEAPPATVTRLPDPAPEAPDDEGRGGPVLIGVRPLKAIRAGLTRELGSAATADERHALLGAIVGHPVEHSAELTRADGYRVLDYFDRFADGSSKWEFVEGGADIAVYDTREPPDDV